MPDLDKNDISATLVNEVLKENRANRRWKNIRFVCWFLLFAYIFINIFSHVKEHKTLISSKNNKYVSFLRLDGMIAPGRDFSGETLLPLLHDAFSDPHTEGVIIDINSPGGTPVQAAIIHDAIIAYKKKYHKKIVIVGEDLLTSGAYFIAVAADKIYVNPNSITGSIGVVMKGFGFVDTLKKMGIERRVYISGNEKDRLDPFLPQSPEDVKKIKDVMNEVHINFINAVREGRKGKLQGDPAALFSGDFWSGQSALKLGLVDGLGNLDDVMEKEFHTTNYKEYGNTTNFFKLLGNQMGSALDMLFYSSPI